MAITFSSALASRIETAVGNLFNLSGGAPKVELKTSADAVLATFTLGAGSFVNGGWVAQNTTTAGGTGTVARVFLTADNGGVISSGSVGTVGTEAFVFNTLSITSGQSVAIANFRWKEPLTQTMSDIDLDATMAVGMEQAISGLFNKTGAPQSKVAFHASDDTLLATINLGAVSFNSSGVWAVNTTGTVSTAGTVNYALFHANNDPNTETMRVAVTATGGGGEIEFNDVVWDISDLLTISNFTIDQPLGGRYVVTGTGTRVRTGAGGTVTTGGGP